MIHKNSLPAPVVGWSLSWVIGSNPANGMSVSMHCHCEQLLYSKTVSARDQAGLVTGFPLRWPRFDPRSGHVVDKVALVQYFSKYFGFSC
jgi:hypothetical protein